MERAATGEDGATLDDEAQAGRLPDHLDAAQLGPSHEPFQVFQDLAALSRPPRAGGAARRREGRG